MEINDFYDSDNGYLLYVISTQVPKKAQTAVWHHPFGQYMLYNDRLLDIKLGFNNRQLSAHVPHFFDKVRL